MFTAAIRDARVVASLTDDIPEKAVAALAAQDDRGLDFNVDFSSIIPKKLEDEPAAITTAATEVNDPLQDEMQQKIVLARAYREMGDKEGALELLREVEREGDAAQQAEARSMLQMIE